VPGAKHSVNTVLQTGAVAAHLHLIAAATTVGGVEVARRPKSGPPGDSLNERHDMRVAARVVRTSR